MRAPGLAGLSLMVLGAVIGAAFMAGPAQAQKSCIRMVIDQRGKTLLNICRACRTVKVEHNRLGAGTPIFRDYTLGPESRLRLPFRGPGRTRVIRDAACTKPNGSAAAGSGGKEKKCVRITRTRNGGPALINTCSACRSLIIERVYAGGRRSQQSFAVAGKAVVPLAQEGAGQFRMVEERACR